MLDFLEARSETLLSDLRFPALPLLRERPGCKAADDWLGRGRDEDGRTDEDGGTDDAGINDDATGGGKDGGGKDASGTDGNCDDDCD